MSARTITEWLANLGLSQYAEQFEANQIDMEVLPSLTGDDLKDIGVAALQHRKQLLAAIRQMRFASGSAALPLPPPPPSFTSFPHAPIAASPTGAVVAPVTAAPPDLALSGAPSMPVLPATPVGASKKRWSWKSFGGRFLIVSVVAHVLFGLGATYYVVQTIQAKRKMTFQGGPKSPNPSSRSVEHKVQMAKKQNTMSAPVQPKRITTTGASKVALPAMPALPKSEAVVVGKISGIGGAGTSLSLTSGVGAGGGASGKDLMLFGLREPHGGLPGTFFDLKQTKEGKPTDLAGGADEQLNAAPNRAYDELVAKFVKSGMSEGSLSKYFRGPATLYTGQVFIPGITANDGPKAFNLADKVQPKRWIVLYKGKVTPPESGNYRFAGFADDVLVVRFNGRVVLDGSLSNPTKDPRKRTYVQEGMPANYRTPVGDSFEVRGGTAYPIEIVIGERPGGFFSAFLLLEKIGVEYEKDAKGSPKLPLFKLASSPLPARGRNTPVVAADTSWSLWALKKENALFSQ